MCIRFHYLYYYVLGFTILTIMYKISHSRAMLLQYTELKCLHFYTLYYNIICFR